jgi:hypothetical protein
VRMPRSATSLLLGFTLAGCGGLDLLGPGCENYEELPSAVFFQPTSLSVGVGQTAHLKLVVRQRAVTRIDLWHGSGPRAASLSGIACEPAASCREIVDFGGSTSVQVWDARSVSMIVTGLRAGRQSLDVDAVALGEGSPETWTCLNFKRSTTVEIHVTP